MNGGRDFGLANIAKRIAKQRGSDSIFVSKPPASDVLRVEMTPQQYLDIEAQQRHGYKSDYFTDIFQREYEYATERRRAGGSGKQVWRHRVGVDKRLASKMRRGLPIPAPYFGLDMAKGTDSVRGLIRGQEGRHRAHMARAMGVKTMPVDLRLNSDFRSHAALGAHSGTELTPAVHALFKDIQKGMKAGKRQTTWTRAL